MEQKYNTDYHTSRSHGRHTGAEGKGELAAKYILSLLLSLFLCAVIAFTGLRACVLNPKYIAGAFTSYEYNQQLCGYIKEFASDKCLENGIDSSAADVITYEKTEKINASYILKQFGLDSTGEYDDYSVYADAVCTEFEEQVLLSLKAAKADAEDEQVLNKIKAVSGEINEFILKSVGSGRLDEAVQIIELSELALTVLIAVFCVLSFVLSLIIYFIGSKRYRALRFIAYSAGSAGVTGLITSFAVFLKIRNLDLAVYPKYLMSAFNAHLSNSLAGFFAVSAAMLLIYIILISIVWKMKRKGI